MKKVIVLDSYQIDFNASYEALPLEHEVYKAVREKSPITSISPELYYSRAEGVKPETDIRTDMWDIAHSNMDKVSQLRISKLDGKSDKDKDKDIKQKSEKVIENPKENTISNNNKTGSE